MSRIVKRSISKGKGYLMADIDKGFDNIVSNMLEHASITVGVHSDTGTYKDGTRVAQVYATQEFGTEPGTKPEIPARPTLTTTFDENVAEWNKEVDNIIADFYMGKRSLERGIKRLGVVQMEAVRTAIKKKQTPANAPSTVKDKGFNNPLIGKTRKMVNAINYKVNW